MESRSFKYAANSAIDTGQSLPCQVQFCYPIDQFRREAPRVTTSWSKCFDEAEPGPKKTTIVSMRNIRMRVCTFQHHLYVSTGVYAFQQRQCCVSRVCNAGICAFDQACMCCRSICTSRRASVHYFRCLCFAAEPMNCITCLCLSA